MEMWLALGHDENGLNSRERDGLGGGRRGPPSGGFGKEEPLEDLGSSSFAPGFIVGIVPRPPFPFVHRWWGRKCEDMQIVGSGW